MHIQEIRALSEEDLLKELDGTYRELLNLRFRAATRQLSRISSLRETRLKLARLLTVQRERQLAQRGQS